MNKKTALFIFCVFVVLNAKAHVNLISPVGGEDFNAGEILNIQWEIVISHNTENWDLFFSGDGGITWNPIELDIAEDSLSYQWVVPDTPTSAGQIRIVMDNVGNDYQDNSDNFTISSTTSLFEQPKEYKLRVFPNPMTDKAIIIFANPNNEIQSMILYNTKGQVVRELSSINSHQIILKRNNLEKGMYFFQLRSKNEIRATGKVIIE